MLVGERRAGTPAPMEGEAIDRISVLFVDDEALMLELLSSMMEGEDAAFRVAGYEKTGQAALRRFAAEKLDVVVLDISLPEMSGLEIARRMRKADPTVSIVFLTSYESFDYAREAVQIGAATYLLKHNITKGTLLQALHQAAAQKRREDAQAQAQMRQLLHDFARGRTLTEEELGLLGGGEDTLCALAVLAYPAETPRQGLADLARRFEDDDGIRVAEAVNLSGQYTVVLFHLESSNRQDHRSQRVCRYTLLLRDQMAALLAGPVYAVCSAACVQADSLWNACRKCVELAEHWKFFDHEDALYAEDYTRHLRRGQGYAAPVYDNNSVYDGIVQAADSAGVAAVLEPLFAGLAQGYWDRQAQQQLTLMLQLVLQKMVAGSALEVFMEQVDVQGLLAPMTVRGMQAWFQQRFEELHPFLIERYSHNVQNIMRYIHQHYGVQSSLKQLAVAIGLSEAYVRLLLKKETGLTYLEHLTQFRMGVAKCLLRQQPQLHIYDVAERVGYRDIAYFSQLFKKVVGAYPVEFRTRWLEVAP